MPGGFLGRSRPGAVDDEQQALSLRQIEDGSIPLAAQRRLRQLADRGGLFTSDLSVSEFALGHRLGLRPLCQVMGSSIYQVGYQQLPWDFSVSGWAREQVSEELPVLTRAWNDARRRAFDRLGEEARLAGADAVVGVRLHRGEHDWAAGAVEYVVVGTAVKVPGADPGADPGAEPVLTDLSLQDYWKLAAADIRPVGVVAGTSVLFVVASSAARFNRLLTSARNQEYPEYTRGLIAAREIALAHVITQAEMVGATGIVGVQVDQHVQEKTLDNRINDQNAKGLMITFHVLGTAIHDPSSGAPWPPETVVHQGA